MNLFFKLWRRLAHWLWPRKQAVPYFASVVEGAYPGHLDDRTLYILTEDGEPWEARMICPCGCGAELDLNLLPDQSPRWAAWADRGGRASLHPSVWRKQDCRSHFVLRGGQIRWCVDED